MAFDYYQKASYAHKIDIKKYNRVDFNIGISGLRTFKLRKKTNPRKRFRRPAHPVYRNIIIFFF